jgi:DNA-directed RNA polymerase specialized sigma24 family protein
MSASFRGVASAIAHPSGPAAVPSGGAENGASLLVVQPEIRERLSGLVHNLCHDPNLHEDLLQLALICHWQAEESYPGKTPSWYVQHCASCIHDYLRMGRSVDSLRHRGSACREDNSAALATAAHEDVFQDICECDLFNELSQRVGSTGRQVLRLLRNGLGVREIARELHISHVAVLAHRRHLAQQCRALQHPA